MKLRNSTQRRVFKNRVARQVQKLKDKLALQGRSGKVDA